MVKKSTLIWLVTMFCALYECKYFSILGLTNTTLFYIRQLSYIGMFLFCLTNKNARMILNKYRGFLRIYLLGLLVLGCVEILHTMDVGGLSLHDTLSNMSGPFLKFLAVYPILFLMEYYSFDRICNNFNRICLLILIVQAFVAAVYNTTGLNVLDTVIRDTELLRNGMIRITSTCLTWFVVVFNIYRWQNYSGLKIRTVALAEWIFGILYMILINQSRSQYVAILAAVVMMILFNKRRAKKQVFVVCVLLVGAIVFLQSDLFQNFLGSFALNTEEDTLSVRLEKLRLIQSAFKQHPFWGFGFVGSIIYMGSTLSSSFYFIDYGVIGDYIQYGLVAVYLYLGMIIRMAMNIKRLSSWGNRRYILLVGILTFLLVGMVGFTLLDGSRNFAIPFIWAISEYLIIHEKEYEQRNI